MLALEDGYTAESVRNTKASLIAGDTVNIMFFSVSRRTMLAALWATTYLFNLLFICKEQLATQASGRSCLAKTNTKIVDTPFALSARKNCERKQ